MATLSTLNVRVLGNTGRIVQVARQSAEGRLSKFKKKASKALGAVKKAATGFAIAGGAALVAFGVKGRHELCRRRRRDSQDGRAHRLRHGGAELS